MVTRRQVLVSSATGFVLAATGCGNGGGSGTTNGPVTLQFWAWASNIEKLVDQWNEENPDIQVNLSAPAGGADFPTHVLSAVRAGEGPDMIQAEYTQMPTYVSSGVLADLDSARTEIEAAYSPEVLETVSFDEVLYGVPQDLGPALFLYRTDLFEENGLTPPATWDEFRQLAEDVRALDGDQYLFNFSAIDADQLMGLALQNGAQWWDYTDGEWSVNIDDEATQEVLTFWQGMVEDDLVSTYQTNSPEQIEAMASGQIFATIMGAWAPGPLMNQQPETAGNWAANQIPQWEASESKVFARGGSTNAIIADTPHYDEAMEFLTWMNASDEGAEALALKANKFTAALHGQQIDRDPPELMPENEDYWPTAAEAGQNLMVVQWGPNTTVAFTSVTDQLSQAIDGGQSWDSVLPTVEEQVSSDLGV